MADDDNDDEHCVNVYKMIKCYQGCTGKELVVMAESEESFC